MNESLKQLPINSSTESMYDYSVPINVNSLPLLRKTEEENDYNDEISKTSPNIRKELEENMQSSL